MKHRKLKLALITIGVIVLIFMCWLVITINWTFAPTESSPKNLILSVKGGLDFEQIIIKNYNDDKIIRQYVLNLVEHVPTYTCGTFQKYPLPKISEGRTELCVKITEGDKTKTVNINYDDSYQLYKKGLLIHSAEIGKHYTSDGLRYSDNLIYIISGKDRKTYFNKYEAEGWNPVQGAPEMKKIYRNDPIAFMPDLKEWKKVNKWTEEVIDK